MFNAEYNKEEIQNYCSNLRLVISGSCLEFYNFRQPVLYGTRRKKSQKDKDTDEEYLKQKKLLYAMSEEEKSLSSGRRAKKTLRRLIKCNVWKWTDIYNPYMPITLTLTFRDEIRSIEEANNLFSNFIQRLNYSINLVERGYPKKEAKKNLLKYSAVIEFQDKNRGGVIHYHIIFYNLPKMSNIYDRLNEIWGKGYFWVGSKGRKRNTYIKDNKKLEKIIGYFTKYITKSFEDKRLKNKKKYFNSRGLIEPIEIEVKELIDIVMKNIPKDSLDYGKNDLSYKYKLTDRYFDYQRFDLGDYPEELKEVLETVYRFQKIQS